MKAVANLLRFLFALCSKEVSTNAASIVLRLRLNPNCSSPSILLSSTMFVISLHILTVIRRRMFEGTVIGR